MRKNDWTEKKAVNCIENIFLDNKLIHQISTNDKTEFIDGYVYVNGNKLEESYVKEFIKGDASDEYPIQVGEKSVFVLSDERDILTDSRNEEIGQIKYADIIGKVIIKIWPIKQLKIIK